MPYSYEGILYNWKELARPLFLQEMGLKRMLRDT